MLGYLPLFLCVLTAMYIQRNKFPFVEAYKYYQMLMRYCIAKKLSMVINHNVWKLYDETGEITLCTESMFIFPV
jgi:hypothetical protein